MGAANHIAAGTANPTRGGWIVEIEICAAKSLAKREAEGGLSNSTRSMKQIRVIHVVFANRMSQPCYRFAVDPTWPGTLP
jgi:hypothetical protein